MVRRATGALEEEVLAVLWRAPVAATPAEVRDAVAGGAAYTTIQSTLTRLWRNGLLERERRGRAFAYRPRLSEAEMTAARMQASLRRVRDRRAALSRFVDGLSRRDEAALRELLAGGGEEP